MDVRFGNQKIQICKKVMQIMKWFWGVVVRDNCHCYTCGWIDHIAEFFWIQPASQEERPIQQQPFNNIEVIKYEEIEEEVPRNKDHQ